MVYLCNENGGALVFAQRSFVRAIYRAFFYSFPPMCPTISSFLLWSQPSCPACVLLPETRNPKSETRSPKSRCVTCVCVADEQQFSNLDSVMNTPGFANAQQVELKAEAPNRMLVLDCCTQNPKALTLCLFLDCCT